MSVSKTSSEAIRKIIARVVAKKIVNEIMTNSSGQKAVRMQLKIRGKTASSFDELDGGGYCESALIDIVEKLLNS